MSNEFEISAESRADVGKGASRRLRRENKVPAIVYGANKEAESLVLDQFDVNKHLSTEAFYSHILTLKVGGKKQKVVLKAVQRHPYKPQTLHMDFLRIKASEAIHMTIPLHFINEAECPGVKAGGTVSHMITSLEITCLPKDLPEFVELDLANLGLDESIHLSEIKLPEGVKLTHADKEHDQSVVNCHVIQESKEDVEADEAEAALAEAQHAVAEAESEAEETEVKPEGAEAPKGEDEATKDAE